MGDFILNRISFKREFDKISNYRIDTARYVMTCHDKANPDVTLTRKYKTKLYGVTFLTK